MSAIDDNKSGEISKQPGSLPRELRRGSISWMARNPVAANLLMALLLVGGVVFGLQIKQEVFPEFDTDSVRVVVPYPGASPKEVESGIVVAVEEAVRGLDGVKRVTARAAEGVGTVTVELLLGTEGNKALTDIKNAIDRIKTFPQDAERPTVELVSSRREVISLVLYGDVEESTLRDLAQRAREQLMLRPGVTLVELAGVRPVEISVEVSREDLRRYDLTLDGVAGAVRRAAVEVPAGSVKTASGEVLLRTAERRDRGSEIGAITLISGADGTRLRLADIARVKDGLAETDQSAYFNGKRAAMVKVYRVGDQTPISVADAVFDYAKQAERELPAGVSVATVNDASEMYRQRIDLMLRNAYLGLALVLIVLGLFLELRLAFWVTMGIPISFLGALLLLPSMDVSINMISLFGFIVTLGLVVDDAVIVGENIYHLRRQGVGALEAAVRGARQVGRPVLFSVATTIAAFMPMFFVPGAPGKFFRVLPAVVVSVLIISLVESLWILPAHLGHLRRRKSAGRITGAVSRGLQWVIERTFVPVLQRVLAHRYLSLATAVALLVATFGFVGSGRIDFTFLPKVDSDMVTAQATLPFGVPVSKTRAVQERLLAMAREVAREIEGEGSDSKRGRTETVRGIFSEIGAMPMGGGPNPQLAATGGHLTYVRAFLVPSDQRDFTATEFARRWRERARAIAGIDLLAFNYTTGPSGGAALDIELRHAELGTLERAATRLADQLRGFSGVRDIDDGFTAGKPQLDFQLTAAGRSAGLTAADLATQVRAAFYGAEAIRQQRQRDELRVMVRLPSDQRQSIHDVEELLVRTPAGTKMPLSEASRVIRNRSYTSINRADGRRVVNVRADVTPGVSNPNKIRAELSSAIMPKLTAGFAGLDWGYEGENRSQRESMQALGRGFLIAQLVIFALLAVPFRSYSQPLIIMGAVPFGMVGAVAGHILMGYDLSLISLFGIIALAGVVVNDSLLLVDTANKNRQQGKNNHQAVLEAAQRRFRPILLTSLTTFLGLAPMIFETSTQARFLIPMAISLGFGILFATFIILLLVPAGYLVLEDIKSLRLPRSSAETKRQREVVEG